MGTQGVLGPWLIEAVVLVFSWWKRCPNVSVFVFQKEVVRGFALGFMLAPHIP